jgi:hypothetical protein
MKTQATLQAAINKFEEELTLVQTKLEELDDVWLRGGAIMQEREFLVECQKRYDQLLEQKKELDFKIRFTKWVLE